MFRCPLCDYIYKPHAKCGEAAAQEDDSAVLLSLEVLGMVLNVILHEGGDEEVAMVVTLQTQR